MICSRNSTVASYLNFNSGVIMNNPHKIKIAVYETSASTRRYLRDTLAEGGIQAICFERFHIMLENLQVINPAGALIGIREQDDLELYVNAVKDADEEMPVMVVKTSYDSGRVQGFEGGGVSWVPLHSEPRDLIQCIQTRVGEREPDYKAERQRPVFIGRTPEILRLREQVVRISPLDDTIFIQGESGSGRENLARYISAEMDAKEFIRINCAELTGEVFNKELLPFLIGDNGLKFAPRGAILLDKVEALAYEAQTLLMGQFDAGEALPVIPREHNGCRWRFIATGSPDLDRKVAAGEFRSDLFHRLSVIKLRLPPLKNRKADIPLLTTFFIYHFSRRWGRACISIPANITKLMSLYSWPGNIDELKLFVADMVATQSTTAASNHSWFSEQLQRMKAGLKPSAVEADVMHREAIDKKLRRGKAYPLKVAKDRYVAKVEKNILEHVLTTTHWNRKRAAELMDISYKSVLNKIRDYGLA